VPKVFLERYLGTAVARDLKKLKATGLEVPDNRGVGKDTCVMTQPDREVKPIAANQNPKTLAKKWAEDMFSASCRTLGRSKTNARLNRSPRL
jgi:hypothetical protein